MSSPVRIRLEPLGKTLQVERGSGLQDVLFPYGVEFPCGGKGRCRRCRIRVLEGALVPASEAEVRILGEEQVAAGMRLACHAAAAGDVTIEIAQWSEAILADDSTFPFTPADGLGVAVDLGTTTLVAQLVDLAAGKVLGVRSALNPQVTYGADVMTRVEYGLTAAGGEKLRSAVRAAVGEMVGDLARGVELRTVSIVGNSVMHHLFCGIDVEPLSRSPFETSQDGPREFAPGDLGWPLAGSPAVRFLPCLGGFVGSDILAGILATRMHESRHLTALMDLGTNGEIAIGNRDRLLCASTAAGPAFEGGRISVGMRAATGAISEARVEQGAIAVRTIGHAPPRGVCGSGLVDAVAAALDLNLVLPSGRLTGGRTALPLAGSVALTQRDIRELQLAKAATAAGFDILLRHWGARQDDVERLYLAGAFGNYLNRASAQRIGLLNLPLEKVEPAGNTALLGAKLSLFERSEYAALRARARQLPLGSDPEFQELYVERMAFPA